MNKFEISSLILNTNWVLRDATNQKFGRCVDVRFIDDFSIQEKLSDTLDESTALLVSNWISTLLKKDPYYKEISTREVPRNFFQHPGFAQAIFDHGNPSLQLKRHLLRSGLLDESSMSTAYRTKTLQKSIVLSGKAEDRLIYDYWESTPGAYLFTQIHNLPKDLVNKLIKLAGSKDRPPGLYNFSSPLQNLCDDHFDLLASINSDLVNSSLLLNPKIPISLMEKIIESDNTGWVPFEAAQNPNCPVEMLELLAEKLHKVDPHKVGWGLAWSHARNPNTPTHVFEILPRFCLQESIAHPNYPQHKYEEMLHKNYDCGKGKVQYKNAAYNVEIIRSRMASNPSLKSDHAEIFLSDPAVKVRSELAKNPSAPDYVLKLLGLEFHKALHEALICNPKIRSSRLRSLNEIPTEQFKSRLTAQIELKYDQLKTEFTENELRVFLDLMPDENKFKINTNEYKRRKKKIMKSKYYQYIENVK